MPEPQDEDCRFTIGNKWLPEVFRRIVGRKCDYDDESDRRLIHCITYMLQLNRVPIGEYGFDMTKKGVLSVELLQDLDYEFRTRKSKPVLGKISPEYNETFKKIQECIGRHWIPYDQIKYVEAVCACEMIHRNHWLKDCMKIAMTYEDYMKKQGIKADKDMFRKAAHDAEWLFKKFW